MAELGYRPKRIKQTQPQPQINGFGNHAPSSAKVNVLQPRKAKPGDRKRIGLNGHSNALPRPGRGPLGASSGIDADPFNAPLLPAGIGAGQAATRGMFEDAQSAFDVGFGESSRTGQKRPGVPLESERGPKGRTMASGRQERVGVVQRDLRAARFTPASGSGGGGPSRSLPIPRVQTSLREVLRSQSDEDVVLEITNAADAGGRNRVAYVERGEDQWLDFVPCAVIGACVTDRFGAVGLEDGSVMIYSPAGRQ